MPAELFAFRKQQLEPQADPQERLSRLNCGFDGLNQSILLQIRHAIAERPDTRQHHMAGISNRYCVAGHNRLVAHRLKSLGHTAQIPHSVIDNGNHRRPGQLESVNNTATGKFLPLAIINERRDSGAKILSILAEHEDIMIKEF
jgi:hypothetical protein